MCFFYLHKQLKILCPPSCCCFWTQPKVGCRSRWLDLEARPHRIDLPKHKRRRHNEFCASLQWARHTCLKMTSQRSFPPESVSDLHVVVPTQITPEQVHGGKVQDNLRYRKDTLEHRQATCNIWIRIYTFLKTCKSSNFIFLHYCYYYLLVIYKNMVFVIRQWVKSGSPASTRFKRNLIFKKLLGYLWYWYVLLI